MEWAVKIIVSAVDSNLGGIAVSQPWTDSATARGFGATVEVATGSLAMCLVDASRDPAAALNTVGARVLATLSSTRVIAVVDMALFGQLLNHADIVSAGSISVDPQRFRRFQQRIGLPG